MRLLPVSIAVSVYVEAEAPVGLGQMLYCEWLCGHSFEKRTVSLSVYQNSWCYISLAAPASKYCRLWSGNTTGIVLLAPRQQHLGVFRLVPVYPTELLKAPQIQLRDSMSLSFPENACLREQDTVKCALPFLCPWHQSAL